MYDKDAVYIDLKSVNYSKGAVGTQAGDDEEGSDVDRGEATTEGVAMIRDLQVGDSIHTQFTVCLYLFPNVAGNGRISR